MRDERELSQREVITLLMIPVRSQG